MKFLRSSERGREEKREGHGKTFVSAAAEQHAASGIEEIEKADGGKKKDRLEREKKLYRYTVCASGDKSRGLLIFPHFFRFMCLIFGPEIFSFQHLYALCISKM